MKDVSSYRILPRPRSVASKVSLSKLLTIINNEFIIFFNKNDLHEKSKLLLPNNNLGVLVRTYNYQFMQNKPDCRILHVFKTKIITKVPALTAHYALLLARARQGLASSVRHILPLPIWFSISRSFSVRARASSATLTGWCRCSSESANS